MLVDGGRIFGTIMADEPDLVTIRLADGSVRRIARHQVRSVRYAQPEAPPAASSDGAYIAGGATAVLGVSAAAAGGIILGHQALSGSDKLVGLGFGLLVPGAVVCAVGLGVAAVAQPKASPPPSRAAAPRPFVVRLAPTWVSVAGAF